MTDFAVDGAPMETPIDAADATYAATPPSLGSAFGASFGQGSALGEIGRFVARSAYESGPAAMLGRALAVAGASNPLAGPAFGEAPDLPTMARQPSPMLSAGDINARFAPMGPDGKPVSITDAPMPEAVGRLVGQAKEAEITREGVISRFEAAHSWPVNFAVGAAALLADPLNLAASFLPGVGEDAIAARLGTGLVARLGARVAAGATAGAVAQAPLAALRYGLGQQEASDYGLREAFRDMMFSAAGGAIAQAGFGTLGDLLRRRGASVPGVAAGAPAPAATPPQVASVARAVAGADAATQAGAMHAVVGQIVDGRAVDAAPVLAARSLRTPPRPEDINQFLAAQGGLADQGGELHAIGADAEVIPFRGRLVKPGGASLDAAREAAEEAGFLPSGSTVSDLVDAIDQTMRGRPVFAGADLNAALDWHEAQAAHRFGDPNEMFADLADGAARTYSDGFAPGIPQRDFDAAHEAIYGTGEREPGEDEEAADETDAEIAAATQRLGAIGIPPEDLEELGRTATGVEDAAATGAAYQEAAGCLRGAGA